MSNALAPQRDEIAAAVVSATKLLNEFPGQSVEMNALTLAELLADKGFAVHKSQWRPFAFKVMRFCAQQNVGDAGHTGGARLEEFVVAELERMALSDYAAAAVAAAPIVTTPATNNIQTNANDVVHSSNSAVKLRVSLSTTLREKCVELCDALGVASDGRPSELQRIAHLFASVFNAAVASHNAGGDGEQQIGALPFAPIRLTEPEIESKNGNYRLISDDVIYHILPRGTVSYSPTPASVASMRFSASNIEIRATTTSGSDATGDALYARRLHRYCFWYLRRDAQVPAIDATVRAAGLAALRNKLIGVDRLTERMATEFQRFKHGVSSKSLPRGVVMFGPPGTGKTTLVSELCDALEVLLVCKPLAAGDFRKRYVGDSEAMLNAIAARAACVPWQLCVVGIDEIDGLAPSRRSNEGGSSSSVDLLSVILSIVGGAKNQPNLCFFGSTNRRDKMDDAFMRRMDFQYYVGRPGFDARMRWLTHDGKLGLSATALAHVRAMQGVGEHPLDFVVANTLNFSHDAMMKLIDALNVDAEERVVLDRARLLRHIDLVASNLNIRFGSWLLPTLAQARSSGDAVGDAIRKYGVRHPRAAQTYRMIIDLSARVGNVQVEFLPEHLMSDKAKEVFEELLRWGDESDRTLLLEEAKEHFAALLVADNDLMALLTKAQKAVADVADLRSVAAPNKETLLAALFPRAPAHTIDCKLLDQRAERIANAAFEKFVRAIEREHAPKVLQLTKHMQNVQQALQFVVSFGFAQRLEEMGMLDLIDMSSRDIHSEQECIKWLNAVAFEMQQAHHSAVVFDLDSLAGVSKQLSGLSDDVTDSARFDPQRSATFNYELHRPQLFDAAIAQFRCVNETQRCWSIAIVEHADVARRFKDALGWLTAADEQDKAELAERKRKRRCLRCRETYTLHDEQPNACARHMSKNLQVYADEMGKQLEASVVQAAPLLTIDQALERLASSKESGTQLSSWQLRWTCCGKPWFEKGEVPSAHEEDPNYEEMEVRAVEKGDELPALHED